MMSPMGCVGGRSRWPGRSARADAFDRCREKFGMQFVIVGAGAIGGSAGAYLMQDGHEVILVDSAMDHIRAMRTDGLAIEGRLSFTVRPTAVTPDGLADALRGRTPEVVILAVKAQHTEQALAP